jgi:hypothetical protein
MSAQDSTGFGIDLRFHIGVIQQPIGLYYRQEAASYSLGTRGMQIGAIKAHKNFRFGADIGTYVYYIHTYKIIASHFHPSAWYPQDVYLKQRVYHLGLSAGARGKIPGFTIGARFNYQEGTEIRYDWIGDPYVGKVYSHYFNGYFTLDFYLPKKNTSLFLNLTAAAIEYRKDSYTFVYYNMGIHHTFMLKKRHAS